MHFHFVLNVGPELLKNKPKPCTNSERRTSYVNATEVKLLSCP